MPTQPRAVILAGAAVAIVTGGLVAASPALAAGSVVVSQTTGLDPDGQELTVTGTGFDEGQGIYVTVCRDNGPGQQPTPCLGGMDTDGTGSSAWVTSNPPYDDVDDLVTPFGPGGSFEVTIYVVANDPRAQVDCAVEVCSVVTRADHTATEDRSQDTRTPLTFAASDGVPAAPVGEPSTTEPSAEPSTGPATEPPTPSLADATATTAETLTTTDVQADAGSTDEPAATADDTSSGVPAGVWVAAVAVAALLLAGLVLASRRSRRSAPQ